MKFVVIITIKGVVVVVVVFFILSDRASTIPSNIRGCQSGKKCSAGQKHIRGTSTKLQREQKKNTNKNKNDKEKGTKITTKYTSQKKIDEGHSIERTNMYKMMDISRSSYKLYWYTICSVYSFNRDR